MYNHRYEHIGRMQVLRPLPQTTYLRPRSDINNPHISYTVNSGRRLPIIVTLPGVQYDNRRSLPVSHRHVTKQKPKRHLVQHPGNKRVNIEQRSYHSEPMHSPRSIERMAAVPTPTQPRRHETTIRQPQTLSVDSGLHVSDDEFSEVGLDNSGPRQRRSSIYVQKRDTDLSGSSRMASSVRIDRRKSTREIRRAGSRRKSVFDTMDAYGNNGNDNVMDIYKEEDDMMGEDIPVIERIKIQKERITEVRLQPLQMKNKLELVRKARSFVEKYEGKLSRSQGYQQKGAQIWKKLKREISNVVIALLPWEMRIKRIESHFGSVVASYFVFLRWMIWINIWLTLLPLCFIIIPEMVSGNPHGSQARKRIPDDQTESASDLKTIWDAEGLLKYSPLFYGYYGADEKVGEWYRLPLAYLITGIAAFAFSFIMVLRRMAANARQKKETSEDEQFTFSWKLFTEWDCTIGNAETSSNKRAAVVTTFRECILEEQEKQKEVNVCLTRFLRVIANILVLILLAASTYVIILCVEESREVDKKKKITNTTFWEENQLTVVMTIISTIFPNVFELISSMEKYHPRITLRLQLARIFALNLLNIYTLFFALFYKQEDINKNLKSSNACLSINDSVISTTSATVLTVMNATRAWNTTVTPTTDIYVETNTSSSTNCSSVAAEALCWETMVGQEVFKLTIMDTIFMFGQIIIQDFLRGLFVRYCNPYCCWDLENNFPEYGDFKTPENLLHLINNQGMIWLGAFFAPGLPLLNMLKLMLLVYIRCWSVMACNVPQERIFRASRSNNFYFAMLLMMLFLSTPPSLFAIAHATPSPHCGPFSGKEKMFHVLTNMMEEELPSEVSVVLGYVASPGVVLPVMLLLGLAIYYLVSLSRSLKEANSDLKLQLQYERTDGRKKVYAMADAKREMESEQGGNAPNGKKSALLQSAQQKKLAKDIGASVMAAARMGRMLSSANGKLPNNGNNKNNGAKNPPVAVVQGKKTTLLSPKEDHMSLGLEKSEKSTDIEHAQKIISHLFSSKTSQFDAKKEAVKEESKTREILSNILNSKHNRDSKRQTNEQSGTRNSQPTTVVVHHYDSEFQSDSSEHLSDHQQAEAVVNSRANVPKKEIPPKPAKTIKKRLFSNERPESPKFGIQNPSYTSDREDMSDTELTLTRVRSNLLYQNPTHLENSANIERHLQSQTVHRPPIVPERVARAGSINK